MSSMNEQALKERVKNIAQAQGRTFNNVWQEVLLERWLVRLVASKYSENFVFKGAMCLVQYLELDRETRDLDFLVKGIEVSLKDITSYLNEVCSIDLKDGFTFVDLEVGTLEHTHMKYPGHAVSVWGVMGNTKTKIFIDIGVGDTVSPTQITMELIGLKTKPLFEKDLHIWAYPVESIFAEKLETAISRGDQNSRMKDFHDLLAISRSGLLNISKSQSAIAATFSNRGTILQQIAFDENLDRYWKQYFKSLTEENSKKLPMNINDVIEELNQFLKLKKLI